MRRCASSCVAGADERVDFCRAGEAVVLDYIRGPACNTSDHLGEFTRDELGSAARRLVIEEQAG